ncbi:MAG: hypothetical protein FWC82_04225, partial [Firmicutes bacterium]|nr:hypothetical protein [Bacillota bacterium]
CKISYSVTRNFIRRLTEKMIRVFHYLCPDCGEETTIHDCFENEMVVFCYCEIDKYGDGVAMELQNPPSTRAFWSVSIDFSIGGRIEPTEDEIEQIAGFIKDGYTSGEFEGNEFACNYY